MTDMQASAVINLPDPIEPPTGSLDYDAIIEHLASLSAIEYDRCRSGEAERLGIRTSTLDREVAKAHKGVEHKDGLQDVEPWPDQVNPADLLDEIASTVRRFIVCPEETAHAAALWVAMTWFMDVVNIAPLAIITAPEKRCGKSQMLHLLGRMVRRPLTASNISPAALFRSIDAWHPTLMVDEADAFMRDNEDLRGLLNAGHTRDSAYVVRVVGDDHAPVKFTVWGAKALAGIGHLADTLMDRAIVLELRRKLPHEQVDRLRYAEPGLFDDIAAKLARFSEDAAEVVRRSRPDLPASLNDRAQDNWEPLLAIAEVAGSHWPATARSAALNLADQESSTASAGAELLADIQEVFEVSHRERLSTAEIIQRLCDDDEKPWASYNRGKPISPRQLSNKLKSYGIRSKNVRIGMGTPKGFTLDQFQEAFARYLSLPSELSATTPQPSQNEDHRVVDVADKAPHSGN